MNPRQIMLMWPYDEDFENLVYPNNEQPVVVIAGPYCICAIGSVGGVIHVGRIENEAVLGSVGGTVDTSTVCVCA